MRQIEFRARWRDNLKVIPDFCKELRITALNDEDFIVEQFTGLTDKNGVKIFEGDILRNPPKTQWEEENYVAFEVFWHDNNHAEHHIGWQFNRLHFHGSVGGYNMHERFIPKYAEQMVVIGNIHDERAFETGGNVRQKAIWRTALENCTDKTFSKKRQIKNLQELAIILGAERGMDKQSELCGFIQGLRCHIVNRGGL